MGSLADAGRADEAQDRAFQAVGACLDGKIFDDPVLDLFKAIMILVEDCLGFGDVALQTWVEVCNENGGRSIIPFNGMLPGDAYLWSKYSGASLDRFGLICTIERSC